MEIQDILNFTHSILSSENIDSIDKSIAENIQNLYAKKSLQDKLDSSDVEQLRAFFDLRWQHVNDKPMLDYTLNPRGINLLWINFAKSIAAVTHTNYLYILIPVIANKVDYNTLSSMSQKQGLGNFFLGHDKKTLYRKTSFIKHLLSSPYKFSICRDLQSRKLSPVTVDELSRLNICAPPKRELTVQDEAFISYWDFLCKRIFVSLQSKGGLPRELLIKLNQCVSYYFSNKGALSYSEFREYFDVFLNYLYALDLDDINYFYGERLKFNGVDVYMLEVLVSIFQSGSLELDAQMNSLQNWLTSKTAVDNLSNSTLGYIRGDQSKNITHQQLTDIHRCFALVVSLLVSPSDYSVFQGVVISLWDKSNTVFSLAESISKKIFPLLENNKYRELADAYNDVLNMVKTATASPGFFQRTWHPKRIDWYTIIQSGNFAKLSIYWFEPEVMLQVLLAYPCKNLGIRDHIVFFLEQLIRTYGTHENRMMKAVRVNVIFYEFIKKFNKDSLFDLIQKLNEIDYAVAKKHFINHCHQFINYRLNQLIADSSNAVPQNIAIKEVTNFTLMFLDSTEEIDNVAKLIAAFKQGAHVYSSKIEEKGAGLLLTRYLSELSEPILSINELKEVDRANRPADYLNSPT